MPRRSCGSAGGRGPLELKQCLVRRQREEVGEPVVEDQIVEQCGRALVVAIGPRRVAHLAPQYRELWNKTLKPLGFKGGNSPQILYPTTATTRDYAYERHGAMSMTLEVGNDFRPAYSEVEQMWAEMNQPLLTILEAPGLQR